MRIMILTAILTAALCVCAFSLICRQYQRQMQKELTLVLNQLDQALLGRINEVSYDESLTAAIGERLNRLVQIQNAHLEETKAERDRVKALISDISHQVRTPLANIMLYTGLLKEEFYEKSERDMANQIEKQAQKLDFFMKDLVKTSYTETELISLHPVLSSVDELIDLSCQNIELLALKKKIIVTRKDSKCLGCFDLKWTVEALGNILENAVKYSPMQSEICIQTLSYDSFICIQVIDQGIGIEEKEQGAVFLRFYRSKQVTQEQGLGIGLYLAREIIEKQGGYIKIHSRPLEGSTFSVFLPRRLSSKGI